jgi:hypothetical protein
MRTILAITLLLAAGAGAPAAAQQTREEFVAICAPKMVTRPPAKPEPVCECVWDKAVLSVTDSDLRAAALRGYRETGVFSIQNDWVPAGKRGQIQDTLAKLAVPVFSCMAGGLQ